MRRPTKAEQERFPYGMIFDDSGVELRFKLGESDLLDITAGDTKDFIDLSKVDALSLRQFILALISRYNYFAEEANAVAIPQLADLRPVPANAKPQ